MKTLYAPGCALMLYKPELAQKVLDFLNSQSPIPRLSTCCRNASNIEADTVVINTCAGCDRRYRENYAGASTRSLWEILADSSFPFPDYQGVEMSIHDACPTRSEARVHDAVRKLLAKMNIKHVEPSHTRENATCCGDRFYGILPLEQVKQQMKNRAAEFPRQDVVVYCVSCIKALHIGGKNPRYLVDLLFKESTVTGHTDPVRWHAELQRYIDQH